MIPGSALTPELVLRAYGIGIFPMAQSADDAQIHWIQPRVRGQIPILDLRISKSLRKAVKGGTFDVRVDTAFERVIDACAAPRPGKAGGEGTWINRPIRDVFVALSRQGYAHSVECWKDGKLAGGLYGLALGGVFCGESMFSRETDASKVALVHLCARLHKGGFTVLDTQFITPHLESLGAYEIPDAEYQRRLESAVKIKADFMLAGQNEKDLLRDYFAARDIHKAHGDMSMTGPR